MKEKRISKGKRREKKMTNPTMKEFQYGLQAKLTPEIILDKGETSDEKNDIDTVCSYVLYPAFLSGGKLCS